MRLTCEDPPVSSGFIFDGGYVVGIPRVNRSEGDKSSQTPAVAFTCVASQAIVCASTGGPSFHMLYQTDRKILFYVVLRVSAVMT